MSLKASQLGVPVAVNNQPTAVVKAITEVGISLKKFQEESTKDSLHIQLRKMICQHWPLSKKLPPTLLPFSHLRKNLSINKATGLIMLGNTRILVPGSLQGQLLSMAHTGHPMVHMKRSL